MTLDELRDCGEQIRLAINHDLQLTLDYDAYTVEWIDGYIFRNQDVFSAEKRYGWALALGYILGESMVQVYGGRWVQDEQYEDEWLVELPRGIGRANPIGKAEKCLVDPSDSIFSFFRIAGVPIERGGFDKIG